MLFICLANSKRSIVSLFFTHIAFVCLFNHSLFGLLLWEEPPPSTTLNEQNITFISLGQDCEVARQLRRKNLSTAYFPLDWIRSPDIDKIIDWIENNFKDFLSPECLEDLGISPVMEDHSWIRNTKYDFQFIHEFVLGIQVADHHEILEKFARRIQRLQDLLLSGKKICFIRKGISYNQAERFCKVMATAHPLVKYMLIALDVNEAIKKDWRLNHVRNIFLSDRSGWNSDEDWDSILRKEVYKF